MCSSSKNSSVSHASFPLTHVREWMTHAEFPGMFQVKMKWAVLPVDISRKKKKETIPVDLTDFKMWRM